MLSTIVRLLTITGRIVALAGAALTTYSAASWVVGWLSAPSPDWNVGAMPLALSCQALLAGWLAWSAVAHDRSTIFRNALIAFAVSFVAFYGWYFLLLWGEGAAWLVSGNLAYGGAGALLGAALLASKASTANGAAT